MRVIKVFMLAAATVGILTACKGSGSASLNPKTNQNQSSSIKMKNGVLTINNVSEQGKCLFGVDSIITKDDITRPIFKGFANKYILYYKCKNSAKIIPIDKQDTLTVDQTLYYNKPTRVKGMYVSDVNSPERVSTFFDENLSTYVLLIKPSALKYTAGEYPEYYSSINNLTFTHAGKTHDLGSGSLGKFGLATNSQPTFDAYSGWEIKYAGFDTKRGQYVTTAKDGVILDLSNLQGIYQGSNYAVKTSVGNISLDMDVDAEKWDPTDKINSCKRAAIIKELSPSTYQVSVDPLILDKYSCDASHYQVKLSLDGSTSTVDNPDVNFRYVYPFPVRFEKLDDFRINQISLTDFTGANLKVLYIPQVGGYKYYINKLNLQNNYYKDFQTSFDSSDVGKLVVYGMRLEKVSFEINNPLIKVGQDNNRYYLYVPEKSAQRFTAKLVLKTTWRYLETGKEVSFDSEPVTINAEYGSTAFDDVKFQYYNDLGQLIDLRDPKFLTDPVFIWQKGHPIFVRLTGRIFKSAADSPRVDITSLMNPDNWSIRQTAENGKLCRSVNDAGWVKSTNLAWSNSKNTMIQSGTGVGQDCVLTYIEDSDSDDFHYLINSKRGDPNSIENFKVQSNVINHVDLGDESQFRFSYDLTFNVGDKNDPRGESTTVCHGSSFTDCGGVSMFYSDVSYPRIKDLNTQTDMGNIIPYSGQYYLYLRSKDGQSRTSDLMPVQANTDYNQKWNLSGPYSTIGGNNNRKQGVVDTDYDIKLITPSSDVDWDCSGGNSYCYIQGIRGSEIPQFYGDGGHKGLLVDSNLTRLAYLWLNRDKMFIYPYLVSRNTSSISGSEYRAYIAYPNQVSTYNFTTTFKSGLDRRDQYQGPYYSMVLFSVLPTTRPVTLTIGLSYDIDKLISASYGFAEPPTGNKTLLAWQNDHYSALKNIDIQIYKDRDGLVYCKDADSSTTDEFKSNICNVSGRRAIVSTQKLPSGKETVLIDMVTKSHLWNASRIDDGVDNLK